MQHEKCTSKAGLPSPRIGLNVPDVGATCTRGSTMCRWIEHSLGTASVGNMDAKTSIQLISSPLMRVPQLEKPNRKHVDCLQMSRRSAPHLDTFEIADSILSIFPILSKTVQKHRRLVIWVRFTEAVHVPFQLQGGCSRDVVKWLVFKSKSPRISAYAGCTRPARSMVGKLLHLSGRPRSR